MVSAALVASLVGFGSTVALVLAAAKALGADPVQTSSWIFAVCFAKAIGSIWLSRWSRVPVVLAWSTPGAALLAASSGFTINQAVAAFVFAGILFLATGVFRPLGKLIAMIPEGVAAAMLAGVLLPFCLRGSDAAQAAPLLVVPMIATFLLIRLWQPAWAVLAALAVGLVIAFASSAAQLPSIGLPLPQLTFITPDWSLAALLGIGLPLYLATMASQNLPGFAVLRAAGYEPPVERALMVTGGISAVSGLFGAHSVNMAAITAAICINDEVHPDRDQRWKVGVAYGVIWMILGLISPLLLQLLEALPPQVMAALVALALLGPLMGAMAGAFLPVPTRFAAVVTLAVTASGLVIWGLGAPIWGLGAGLLVHLLEQAKDRAKAGV